MISFQNIEFLLGLLLLVPLVLLFMWVLRWKRTVVKKIGDKELVDRLVTDYSPRNYNWKFICVLVALALCVAGAANLRITKAGVTDNLAGVDVMVALDVSNSMLAQDVQPNRLARAKQVINRVIEQMDNNRMGLVVFAGQAFLQMPLTTDLSAARLYISNAAPEAVPVQGTEIDQALSLCNTSHNNLEKKYKAIVLITDGEDHDEAAIEVAHALREDGVVIHTIGIGSAEGAPVPDAATGDFKKDENGNTVVSKLNEQDLQQIASITGGTYQRFTKADVVADNVVSALNQMEKKLINGGGARMYTSFFQWFLLLAFVLLVLEIFIPERKMKWFAWGK